MNNLLDKMESDVRKPTIGDNSLKEMADLCAEQVALLQVLSRYLLKVPSPSLLQEASGQLV